MENMHTDFRVLRAETIFIGQLCVMPMQLDYYSSVMLVKFDHKCHVHKLSSKLFGSLWLEKQLLCSFF